MNRFLLANHGELAALSEKLGRQPFDRIHDLLRRRCSMILQVHPVTETDWRQQYARGVLGAALTAARTAQGRIFDLAIAHHMDPNGAFRDRAVEELVNLAGWSEWVSPVNRRELPADLCTAECAATMALGLDWLADEMPDEKVELCRRALLDKGLRPYVDSVRAQAWWADCYHNWNAVINSASALAAMLLRDEEPLAAEAESLGNAGLKHFFDALGSNGGWDEGPAYWGYALRYLLMLARARARTLDDHGLLGRRGMEATCAFGMFFSPLGRSLGFGDSPVAPLYGGLYGAADLLGSREMCWWLDRWGFQRDVEVTGWSDAGLALLLRPAEIEDRPRIAPPVVKVFHEIGWAALVDAWCEPRFYASVKTGDLSAHHSHLDMNSVQVLVDGEKLLCDTGNPPGIPAFNHVRGNEELYEVSTQAHNTLTVADRNHRIDARGEIVQHAGRGDYRLATASAGDALGENVHFTRHVVMVLSTDGDVATHLVVLDELRNVQPETVQAMWHSYGKITATEADGLAGVIRGDSAALHYRLAADQKIETDLLSHPTGRLAETALRISTGPCRELLLASVFSREPIDALALDRQRDGRLSLRVDGGELRFIPAAGRLSFDSLVRRA